MGIQLQKLSQRQFILGSMITMIAGLFCSRGLLSVGVIAFFLLTIEYKNLPRQIKNFCTQPLFFGISLLFFIPLFSGLWSTNKAEWFSLIRIKLPLFLIPFGFAGNWQVTDRNWRLMFNVFLVLLVSGCAWSVGQYINNNALINTRYLQAKLIPTPFEDDHVRFSWMVSLGALLGVWLIQKHSKLWQKLACGSMTAFFIFYLHLLSARTGLICFYMFLFLFFIDYIRRPGKSKWMLLLLAFSVLLPVVSWFSLPTLRNRFYYNRYDYSYFSNGRYLPGSSDGSRMISIKAGWNILTTHPFGVGFGDIQDQSNEWYEKNIPGIVASDKIYPGSEWLMYGAGAGWPAFFIVTAVLFYPLLFIRFKNNFFWVAVNVSVLINFLIDIPLTTQIGVFCYAFAVLCVWKKGTELYIV